MQGAQPAIEVKANASLLQGPQGRLDEARRQAITSDEGPTGSGTLKESLTHHGREQPGIRLLRPAIEGGNDQRLPETPPKRATSGQQGCNRRALAGPEQGERFKIVQGMAARHPPRRTEDPPGQRAAVRRQSPVLAGFEVEKGKAGLAGPDQAVARPGFAQIGEGGMVRRQQQVVAVVDGQLQARLIEGTAAPAGPSRRFVKADAVAGRTQAQSSGKAGKAGADDVNLGHAGVNGLKRARDARKSRAFRRESGRPARFAAAIQHLPGG